MADLVRVTLRNGPSYLFEGDMEEIQRAINNGQFIQYFYPFQDDKYINTLAAFDRSVLDYDDQEPRDSVPCENVASVDQYTQAPAKKKPTPKPVQVGITEEEIPEMIDMSGPTKEELEEDSEEEVKVDLTDQSIETPEPEVSDVEPELSAGGETKEELEEENAHIYQDITEESQDETPTPVSEEKRKAGRPRR
jgi:hypothetical protein